MALSAYLMGAVQMTSSADRARNLEVAVRLIEEAADSGRAARGTPGELRVHGPRRGAHRRCGAARRPPQSGSARAGAASRHLHRRGIHLREGRRSAPDREHLRAHRRRRPARRRVSQDPPVRREHPRRRALRGVGGGRPWRQGRHRADGARPGRPHHLLRPALPGAVPEAREPRRRGDHHPRGVHALHRQGPLGGARARPRHREPRLRHRAGAGRPPLGEPADVRERHDRRSVGRGAGALPRRRGRLRGAVPARPARAVPGWSCRR